MKTFLFAAVLIFSTLSNAKTPELRERIQPTSIPATALCKDDSYKCMYNCVLDQGGSCQPTRSSDPNCTQHTVLSWSYVSKSVVVISPDNFDYADMGCKLLTPAKTNLVCGNTSFGWDCWIGKMHNDN